MNNEPSLYIVVLNYRGAEDTIECVSSIQNMDYENYVIVIVDNNSRDGSEEIFREKFQKINNIIILQSGKNLGFAGGNNIGISYALEHGADYICVLNNDVILQRDTLQKMIIHMEENPQIGMEGPVICEYGKPTRIQSAGAFVNHYKGEHFHATNEKEREKLVGKIVECDFVTGACMLIKSAMVRKIGLIPEEYFLCWEETEWCKKVKDEQKKSSMLRRCFCRT